MKPDANKPIYKAADERSPAEREKQLLESAHAEGREQPADGSRPLSAAHTDGRRSSNEEGSIKHVLSTGLPPGISEQAAADPGSQPTQAGTSPARNQS